MWLVFDNYGHWTTTQNLKLRQHMRAEVKWVEVHSDVHPPVSNPIGIPVNVYLSQISAMKSTLATTQSGKYTSRQVFLPPKMGGDELMEYYLSQETIKSYSILPISPNY